MYRGFYILILALCFLCFPLAGNGQYLNDISLVRVKLYHPKTLQSANDTLFYKKAETIAQIRQNIVQPKPLERPPDFTNIFMYDFFITINAISYKNAQTLSQQDEINFYYNTTVNDIFKTKYFTYRAYMYNEYGVSYYIDSVTTKNQDRHEVRNSLHIPVKKKINITTGFTVRTQLWKMYLHQQDTVTKEITKTLYSDYFSPGYLIYTGGISINFLKNASFSLGLIGGKNTKIKNQQIFTDRNSKKLYGLEKGETKKLQYAINMMVSVPRQMVTKHLGWECNAEITATKEQIGRIKGYTLDVNNALHYIFLKNLRVTLRTALKYDEEIDKKIFIMNMLSLGFYLFNKL